MGEKSIAVKYGAKIAEGFRRWNYIYENGGSDPFWEDGCNLNLVRSNIISCKRRCQRELEPDEYPQEYFIETPEFVDNKFMVRADEIRENAQKSLEICKENTDYKYLLKAIEKLSKIQKEQTCISNVIQYVKGLQHYIKNDDLVGMRRYENTEMYLKSFRDCRQKIEDIVGEKKVLPLGQLSIFDLVETWEDL